MSASAELQKMIVDRLKADPAVSALIGDAVYDGRPSEDVFPCITIGPSDFEPDEAECIYGREEVLQLDVWSRAQGRVNPCKVIVDAVTAALHDWDGVLPDPYALAGLRVSRPRVFMDSDGITAHGVVPVVALIEERET